MSDVADLYMQGLSIRDVAAELGITDGTVRHALKRAGVRLRDRHASRMLTLDRESRLTASEMAEMYRGGAALYEIAERAGLNAKSVAKRLEREAVVFRSRGEAISLAHGRRSPRPTIRPPSRPPSYAKPRRFGGEHVEPPPPMTSAELFDVHDLSASEKMCVHRLVGILRGGRGPVELKGRPRNQAVEYSPCELELMKSGILKSRRQYHLMTCAIAAAKEAGFTFGKGRESA